MSFGVDLGAIKKLTFTIKPSIVLEDYSKLNQVNFCLSFIIKAAETPTLPYTCMYNVNNYRQCYW